MVDMVLVRDMIAYQSMPVVVIELVLANLSRQDRAELIAALTPNELSAWEWRGLTLDMEQRDINQFSIEMQGDFRQILDAVEGNVPLSFDQIIELGGDIEQAIADQAAGPAGPGDGFAPEGPGEGPVPVGPGEGPDPAGPGDAPELGPGEGPLPTVPGEGGEPGLGPEAGGEFAP